jgi:hypothetical protein
MRCAFLFSFTAPLLVPALESSATTQSEAPELLASAPGLIRQKQQVPDDPLAGLPGTGDDRGDQGGKNGGKGVRSCRISANPANPREIGDLRATLAFVERGPKAWPCPPTQAATTEVRLTIAVDGSGRITSTEPAGGDRNLAAAMAKRLVGQAISPRPEGPTRGTVVLGIAGIKK